MLIDPPKTIKVSVSVEDIAMGVPGSITFCPIAHAIKRVFPNKYVLVAPVYVNVSKRSDCMDGAVYKLPFEADQFMSDFDHGDKVNPVEFLAELVSNE